MKFIFQPVKPFSINQYFAENTACVSTDGSNRVIGNCNGKNPPKGYKSLYGPKGHTGLDLKAKHGQEVMCALDGTIEYIDTHPKSGLDVRIVSEFEGSTYRHIYEHLLGYQGKVGDKVQTGQLVGWADNTGWSSGNHLHFQFEIWKNGRWEPIDPLPHMHDTYARDHLLRQSLIKWLNEFMAKYADNFASTLRQIGR